MGQLNYLADLLRRRKFVFLFLLVASITFGQGFIEQLNVDNLRLDGNTISTTEVNGDIILDPNGSGGVNFNDLTASTVPYLDSNKSLVSSSVTPTTLGYLDATSSIQTQLNAKLGVFSGSTDNVLIKTDGTGGSAIQETGINIDDSNNVANINSLAIGQSGNADASAVLELESTTSGLLPPRMSQGQRDAISSPANGLLIHNTNTNKPNYYNGTNWSEVGSGSGSSSGTKNFITNYSFNTDIIGWDAFDDTTSTPVDGTGGSPTLTLGWTNVSSQLLSGGGSSIIDLDTTCLGEGVSTDFTVDRQDINGKILNVSFDYDLDGTTTNYTSGDLAVFIYDIDNTTLLGRVNNGDNGDVLYSAAPTKFLGTFETTNADDYRLIISCASATSGPVNFIFDEVVVGPDSVVPGAIITNPESFTPSFTNATVSSSSIKKWREGAIMRIKGEATFSAVSGDITFTIPDSKSLVTGESSAIEGDAWAIDGGTLRHIGDAHRNGASITQLTFSGDDGANWQWSATQPMTWASGDRLYLDLSLEIDGWKSTTLISTTESLFKNAFAKYSTATAQSISSGSFQIIDYNTKSQDDLSLVTTGSSWKFTAPSTGLYEIKASILFNSFSWAGANAVDFKVYVNGSASDYLDRIQLDASVTKYLYVNGSTVLKLNKDDYIDIRVYQNSGSNIALNTDSTQNKITVTAIKDTSKFSEYSDGGYQEASSGVISFPITAGNWGDLASKELQPGEYVIDLIANWYSNGATTTTTAAIGVSTTSGNSATGLTFGVNQAITTKRTTSSSYDMTVVPGYRVLVTTPTTYYFKAQAGTSITNLQIGYRMSVRRIK